MSCWYYYHPLFVGSGIIPSYLAMQLQLAANMEAWRHLCSSNSMMLVLTAVCWVLGDWVWRVRTWHPSEMICHSLNSRRDSDVHYSLRLIIRPLWPVCLYSYQMNCVEHRCEQSCSNSGLWRWSHGICRNSHPVSWTYSSVSSHQPQLCCCQLICCWSWCSDVCSEC